MDTFKEVFAVTNYREERTKCANCGNSGAAPDMYYDERVGHYLCDRQCFDEWADHNFEDVAEFYRTMNVDY